MDNNEILVEVKNIGKYYGDIKAVDDVSFAVKKGEVLGFLGPNGAGKSTTMKMLSCFISPSFGTASVKGFDIINSPEDVKRNLGYLPENAPAYEDMTVSDFLDFIADVRLLKGAQKKAKLDSIYELIALKNVRHQLIGTLSKGFKRRVCLAQAILHDPEVLIMDEPTDGLDPNQKFEIRQLIKQMSKDKVIILSTHILEEVDEVCTRAIIIAKGKIVADGTPESLRKKSDTYGTIHLTIEKNNYENATRVLSNLANIKNIVKSIEKHDLIQLDIYPNGNATDVINSVTSQLNSNSLKIYEISVNPGNFSEVFRKITK